MHMRGLDAKKKNFTSELRGRQGYGKITVESNPWSHERNAADRH